MIEPVTRVVLPALVAFIWAGHGLRALVSDDEVSVSALMACVAFVVAGIGLGIAALTLLRKRTAPPVDPEVPPLFFVLLGLTVIGGAVDGLFASAGLLDALALATFSAGGGLLIGASVVLHGLQAEAHREHREAPTSL